MKSSQTTSHEKIALVRKLQWALKRCDEELYKHVVNESMSDFSGVDILIEVLALCSREEALDILEAKSEVVRTRNYLCRLLDILTIHQENVATQNGSVSAWMCESKLREKVASRHAQIFPCSCRIFPPDILVIGNDEKPNSPDVSELKRHLNQMKEVLHETDMRVKACARKEECEDPYLSSAVSALEEKWANSIVSAGQFMQNFQNVDPLLHQHSNMMEELEREVEQNIMQMRYYHEAMTATTKMSNAQQIIAQQKLPKQGEHDGRTSVSQMKEVLKIMNGAKSRLSDTVSERILEKSSQFK
eukprot:jgi/Bigna1/85904/estExt_fgenesh1_pg.C_60368